MIAGTAQQNYDRQEGWKNVTFSEDHKHIDRRGGRGWGVLASFRMGVCLSAWEPETVPN